MEINNEIGGAPVKTFGVLIVGLALLIVTVPAPFAGDELLPPESTVTTAAVDIYVALVTSDLEIRPVPKLRILLEGKDPEAQFEGITSFQGRLTLKVPPGEYSLRSGNPVTFEQTRYVWNLTIRVPESGVSIELSTNNAIREDVERGATVGITDEGIIFQKARTAVVTVVAEGGHGSGFLVDKSGLILTNHHVVTGSEYLAVKLDELRKYPAVLLADDARHDVAVLCVNPQVLAPVVPLALADSSAERSPVVVGERVLAIGSPLVTEGILTTGIVSKLEADVILSDVNINPGSSGGPLLNLLGEVIGINTFGLGSGTRGPGVSGIVRIHKAYDVLAEARAKIPEVMPSSERLPVASQHPYPPEALAELADADFDAGEYHVEAGKIDIQFITPVVIASLEKQAEMRAAKQREKRSRRRRTDDAEGDKPSVQSGSTVGEGSVKDDFYDWRRYAGDYVAVVRIHAIPEIKMTGGSIFAKVMLGANAPGRYRFKADFKRMSLLRSGVEIAPIHPGKIREVVTSRKGVDVMEDIGTYGAYEYPPEAFEPSQDLVLEVYTEQKPNKPKVRRIEKSFQRKIWEEFKPYFDSLEKTAKAGSSVD